jgi:L-amino acid N-acyltransferase YncA
MQPIYRCQPNRASGLALRLAFLPRTHLASIKLLEGLGFEREGLLRQAGFWAGQRQDLLAYGWLASP